MIQVRTSIRPASERRNACSSRPLCFSIWLRMVTRIPTAAILKIRLTPIPFSFKSYQQDGHQQPARRTYGKNCLFAAFRFFPRFFLCMRKLLYKLLQGNQLHLPVHKSGKALSLIHI